MRTADLFAGIGGFRLGFRSVSSKCVFAVEIDKFSRKTYASNHEVDHPFPLDVRNVPVLPPCDMVLAGFPCQPFSIAGIPKRASLGRPTGFSCKSQGNMFAETMRLLGSSKAEIVVLENVPHIALHNKGRTFEKIEHALRNAGWNIAHDVLDASAFLPQTRRRWFLVGFRSLAMANRFAFRATPRVKGTMKLQSVLHPEDGVGHVEQPYTDHSGRAAEKYTLSDNLLRCLRRHAARQKAKGNGFGYSIASPLGLARTLTARYGKDGSEILVPRPQGNPRRLTPRECSRLMGFDEGQASDFVIPVSDTQAYKQFGNAVPPPMARHVANSVEAACNG